MPSTEPVHAFLSYTHADRQVVEALCDYLGWLEHDDQISAFHNASRCPIPALRPAPPHTGKQQTPVSAPGRDA
jgi:hypothetical protein